MNVTPAAILLTLATTLSAAAADADWKLLLDGALGEGRDIELYVAFRDGKPAGAFSRARRFNRMPHLVAAKGAALADGKLTGDFAITIPFDGWVPKGGKPLALTATIEASAADREITGTYRLAGDETRQGRLTGTASPPPDPNVVRRLTLHCEDVVVFDARARRGQARAGMTLSFKDSASFAARVLPAGSITDTAHTINVARHALRLDGPRLNGQLAAVIRRQGKPDEPIEFVYDFEGLVIADAAAGTMKLTRAGKAVEEPGYYVGSVTAGATDPANAIFRMSLLGAIDPYNNFDLYIATRDGKVLGGFATSPNYNNAIHTVNLGGLKLEPGRLRGKIDITLQPDAWIPRDRKPIPGSFELEATLADGEITGGTVSGKFGASDVRGTVEGNIDAKPDVKEIAGLTLKYEGGVFGRAFLSMRYAGGQFQGGKVSNNHTDLTGTVDKADLDFSGDRVRGSVQVTLAKGGVTPGTYTATVDGVLVGTVGAGTGMTTNAKGDQRPTTFWIVLNVP